MKWQGELMAKQLGIDKLKMEEQRKMQMQMWEDTNYAAQVEQLKKAGLSIGLMYGKGGAGGTTTGAGATGVSAPTAPSGMGMINGSQLATQLANIELIKAQTNKTNVEAEKIRGVDTANVEASTKNLLATTDNEKVKNRLLNIQERIDEVRAQISEDTQRDMTEIIWYNLRSAEQQMRKETRENGISDATYNEQIGIIKNQYIQIRLENELIKGQAKLTEQQIS